MFVGPDTKRRSGHSGDRSLKFQRIAVGTHMDSPLLNAFYAE
jgi:hypothetical protein